MIKNFSSPEMALALIFSSYKIIIFNCILCLLSIFGVVVYFEVTDVLLSVVPCIRQPTVRPKRGRWGAGVFVWIASKGVCSRRVGRRRWPSASKSLSDHRSRSLVSLWQGGSRWIVRSQSFLNYITSLSHPTRSCSALDLFTFVCFEEINEIFCCVIPRESC